MTQYRIATNGDRYRIEKRGFLGRWEDAASNYLPLHPPTTADRAAFSAWLSEPLYMAYMTKIHRTWDTRSLEDAEVALNLLLDSEDKRKVEKARKWRSL